ncbi:hypothetical protein F4821DRAFT_242757 [Hypoxylon rubiginosum]|uniref:Uncharacterized protein n=1 Tax=Hypoxylon rubiginosum TaxID=110542 RepID=A0ACC0CVS7_9PEZI|nr:hypothetical protein F4821DRAFT_242757 [Hypoxylon rubiginosum]
MDAIQAEILLEIVLHMDIKSMLQLKRVNKAFAQLISNYERSISVGHITRFPLPPSGNVLSSDQVNRRAIGFGTFEMVRELERRDDRINWVYRMIAVDTMSFPPEVGLTNDTQSQRFYLLVTRSIWQCDQIADLTANRQDSGLLELNNPLSRPCQIDYIRRLPLEDIAMMYYLIDYLSTMFSYGHPDWSESDPELIERITVFEESVLRHGSWFLWAYFNEDRTWKRSASKILNLGMKELEEWEQGAEGTQPGLKQNVMRRFSELVRSRRHLTDKMYVIVRRTVLGTNETWVDSDDEGDEGNEVDQDDDDDDD